MKGIGEMNHRIVLQVREVQESGGKTLDTYRNLYTDTEDGACWAARQDMSNKDFNQATAAMTELTAIFTVRTPPNIQLDSGLRVLEDGVAYDTVGLPIKNKPRRGFTELRTVMRGMEGYGHA